MGLNFSGPPVSVGSGGIVGEAAVGRAQFPSIIIVPEAPDARLRLGAPQTLFTPRLENELAVLQDGGALCDVSNSYLDAAKPLAQIVAGPSAANNAIRAGAGTGPVAEWPFDGCLSIDEWTIFTAVKMRGLDYRSLPGFGTELDVFKIASGTQVIRLFFTGDYLVCTARHEAPYRGQTFAQGTTPGSPLIVVGDFPSDTWVGIALTYDAVRGICLRYGRNGTFRASTSSPPSFHNFDSPMSGQGQYGQGMTVLPAGDKGFDVVPPTTTRYSLHPSDISSQAIKQAPTLSITAQTTVRAFPTLIGGMGLDSMFPGDTKNTRVHEITTLKALGCPWIRTSDIADYAPITSLNGLGVDPTIDYTQIDEIYTPYATAGLPIGLDVGSLPVGLRPPSNDARYPPQDANGVLSATAIDAYARWNALVVKRIADLGVQIVMIGFNNEPEYGFVLGYTPIQLADMWGSVSTQIAAKNPTLPAMSSVNGAGDDLWQGNPPPADLWFTKVIEKAVAIGRPIPYQLYHSYSDRITDHVDHLRAAIGYTNSFAIPGGGSKFILSEWNYDLQTAAGETGASAPTVANVAGLGSGYRLEPYRQKFSGHFTSAWAFAVLAELTNRFTQFDGAAMFRVPNVVASGSSGIFEAQLNNTQTDVRTLARMRMYQLIWKMSGNLVATSSNWPAIRGLASKSASGVITVLYGSLRQTRQPVGGGQQRFALRWEGLPTTFTWKQWRVDETTDTVGGAPVIATGDESNLPIRAELDNLGVGAIQITPRS